MYHALGFLTKALDAINKSHTAKSLETVSRVIEPVSSAGLRFILQGRKHNRKRNNNNARNLKYLNTLTANSTHSVAQKRTEEIP